MKTHFVFSPVMALSLLLFVATGTKAQHAITEAHYPDDIVTTIIKEYQYPATISYVETKAHHYFAYADHSMTVISCEIDNDIFVRDFVVNNDEVFFCGFRNGKVSSGLWGWFKIIDLINSNLSYDIYENFNCNNQDVDTLHRIATYDYSGTKHIVTVGTTTGAANPNGCTIDIVPNVNGGTMWNYTIGITPNISGERLNRICITDNYVVTGGFAAITGGSDTYRRHLKSNIFATGGPQNDVWYYPIYLYARYVHNGDNYEITHINGDIVASAIQTKDLDDLIYPYGILVMAYDIAALSNGSVSTLYPHYVSTNTYKFNIDGIIYNRQKDKLILLLNGFLPFSSISGFGSIITEIPILSLLVDLYTLNDHILTSMDSYNYQNNMLCQGYDMLQPSFTTYFTQPFSASAICSSHSQIPTSAKAFITKMETAPYTVCSKDFNCEQLFQINSFSTPNDIICSDRTMNNQR